MRLDLATIYAKKTQFLVGLTDVQTGKAIYKETSAQDLEHVLKASSALPLFYRNFIPVDNKPMTDGGVADPIPVAEAVRRGARRIMVIRSRPSDYQRTLDPSQYLTAWVLRRYPLLRSTIMHQDRIYNEATALIHEPPIGVRIIEVCPPAGFHIKRFSRDPEVLLKGYAQGRSLAGDAIDRWEAIG